MHRHAREKASFRRHLAVMGILALLFLPACMGGGGGDESVSPSDNSVIPPTGGSAPDPGVADIREELLAAVNEARAASRMCGSVSHGPSPSVSWSDAVAMAAYLHSSDMALNALFSHTGSDGSSAGQRITRQGFSWRTYGENIAVGYPTVASLVQGWLGSEGHCRNIMDPDFTVIGAGYAVGGYGGNPSARYWTLDLAD